MTITTSNVTAVTAVQSTSYGLALHAQYIFASSFYSNFLVTGDSFPFLVHILCIWYGTVLANTAVPCVRVHTSCLPVRGAPWECITTLQHSIMLRLYFIVKCGIACFLCAMRVFEVRASSSSPRLHLCQISFLLQLPLLSWPLEKNVYSITQSIITQLIWCPGNQSLRFGTSILSYAVGPNWPENVYKLQFFKWTYSICKARQTDLDSGRSVQCARKITSLCVQWLQFVQPG